MTSSPADLHLSGGTVVTGGGSGIGRGTVLACARLGGSVAALDLDPAAAESAADEARALGAPAAIGLRCDVRDEASVAGAIAAASEQIGPPRGLVTCAGVERHHLVHEAEWSDWLDVLTTNLIGTVLACRHALIKMIEHGEGGSIVCISSALSETAVPGGFSSYCASKGGVSAFMRSLALDYATYSIRVNAVIPGATETPLMWGSTPADEVPEARAAVERQLALGRLAEPAEIAAGITWLLSDQASYVTGSHLAVDGGLMARTAIDS